MSEFTLHYGWWLIGLALVAVELLAPGYFMLWIGLAALAVGFLLILMPDLSFIAQAIAFLVCAMLSCWCYWRFVRPATLDPSDQPLLNRRARQFVGQRYLLETAIVNGRGKVRVGDSPWLAEGPDLPAGSEVEVVGVDGTTLKVRAA